MGKEAGDLRSEELAPGTYLHLDPRDDLKTVRLELLLSERLEPGRNTLMALLARVLERGTTRRPDLRAVSRFVDELYGADFGVAVEQCGQYHALRLVLETVDDRFVPAGEALLERAFAFLKEVLREPRLEGNGFPARVLERERAALAALSAGLRNDGLAFAQRRCVEIMAAGETWALPVLGDPAQLPQISADQLWGFHQDLLRRARLDLYASGRLEPSVWQPRCRSLVDWPRQPHALASARCLPVAAGYGTTSGSAWRTVREPATGTQGRLVLGYRTPAGIGDPDYAALVTLNQLWGADSQSRLFQVIRQGKGLCYHIASDLDAPCAVAFVSAGIDPGDLEEVMTGIGDQLARIAGGQVSSEDLAGARAVLRSRLAQLDEDPAGMVAFDYQHRLAGSGQTRAQVGAALAAVTAADVARVAAGLRPDTAYFAAPPAGAVEDPR